MKSSVRPREVDPLAWARDIQNKLMTAEDTGYFGPTSAMWQVSREAVVGLGYPRAVLMQIAHPWVAQAVTDHSTFDVRPAERLLSTLGAAAILIFGSRSQADAVATRINKMHTHIRGVLQEDVGRWRKGTEYRADDPEALLWVLATLIDSALVLYESSFGNFHPTSRQPTSPTRPGWAPY